MIRGQESNGISWGDTPHGLAPTSGVTKEIVVPPVLYLPVKEGVEGIRLAEVRSLTDGRRALLAYTALDRLLDTCGQKQPWALVTIEGLEVICDEQPFDTIAFDIAIPESLRTKGWLS